MLQDITQQLRSIYERLSEIEQTSNRDYHETLKELLVLKEKTESLDYQLDYMRFRNCKEAKRLISAIMEWIPELQYEVSGFNPKVEGRSLYPNIEDYNDYYNGDL